MSQPQSPLERARRGPKGNVDKFLAFWLHLLVEGKQPHGSTPAQVRRAMDKLFRDKDVQAARDAVGDATLAAEFRDAALAYFRTCLTDPGYTTTLWRTKRLEPAQIEAKAAKDAAAIIGALAQSNALEGFAERLPALAAHGFVDAFGPESEAALRLAVGKDPAAAQLAPLIWD
ncbi:hypothetical protein LKO27_11795 [Tessaracoccus sp. OS52]|uniref:DUF6553 family protein n=1 Tax=Tessaracoccus sp. OS52 TaxID=2886691 RepID=UPI001D129F24|nr:DUF6553 family protein [Tessaracoccus sp. OS52]MCC2594089.1 hypothetical protein [Tessaracoccus sp. OS52]